MLKVNLAIGASTAAFAAVFLHAAPAHAENRAAEANSSDIIVTARRVEERLQDVPASVTVFNQEELTKRNISTAQDLVAYTPSLSASGQFGGNNITFTMRGFVQEIGTAPTLGVYFADVVAPRGGLTSLVAGDNFPAGTFFDLQNVQVLKGPQGTLFGRNTTGGAVLVVPKKPTGKFEGYLEGSVGNYNMWRVQGAVNVPLAETVRLRVSVDRQKRDGFIKNTGLTPSGTRIGPEAWSDVDYIALRGSLVVDLSPNIENYTIVSYNKTDTAGEQQSLYSCDPTNRFGNLACVQLANQQARGTGGFYTGQTSVDMFYKQEVLQIINTTTVSVSDNFSIKNIFGYGRFTQDQSTGLFGTLFDAHDVNLAAAVGTPAHNVNPNVPAGNYVDFVGTVSPPGSHFAHQETISDEFRFAGNTLQNRLEYQGGIYYEASNPLSAGGNAVSSTFSHCTSYTPLLCTNPLGAATVSVNRTTNRYRNVGLYSQATFSLTDQLKLTGGLRYTWDSIKNTYSSITNAFPAGIAAAAPSTVACTTFTGTLPDCTKPRNASFKAPTWLIGLDYKPSDDLLLYAKYTRGYRSGNINVALPDALSIVQPEKVNSYEAGVKASFKGAVRGTFNISGFYNDFSNQILRINFNRTATNQVIAAAVNAGKSRIYGVEVESSINPFKGFVLNGNYTYLNAKITDIIFPTLAPNSGLVPIGGFLSGDPLVFSPKHKFTITGTYHLPVDESIGDISLGATYSYVSSQLSNGTFRLNSSGTFCSVVVAGCKITGPSILPSYGLLNLNIDWNSIGGSNFDLALFATNVTKKEYNTYTQPFFTVGFISRQVGQPRMYGARLRYRFGK